ncbi:LytTR family transcriptional regulator DNA-binding domain-containing protein [Lactococcus lactis]|uniref:LytTR family transcriptional regulator DNA-binding domain-containing protein n=1 Tax=Lactococcus lactis TaxID=1358 RepID=UPI003877D9E8
MNTISIYLIEDSISYRMDLKKTITNYLDEQNLVLNFDVYPIQNYTKFYENLEINNINDNDIFIIDIHLNTYFNGIDIGKKIRTFNQNCKIIYLTSAADKAMVAINQKTYPSAYLMKSDDIEITQMQLFKLFTSLILNHPDTDKTITVTSYTSSFILNISDIIFISVFKGAKNKLLISTLDSDLVVDGTLASIKSKLSSPPFYFDFKSIIININNIKCISPFNQLITFKNGSELEMKTKLLYKLLKFQKGLK